jgi:malonyl-CoA O-methyltransferase
MNCNILKNIKTQFGFKNTGQRHGYFVTATDTNVGKSYCSALLMQALGACYFKPIQAGDLATGGDTALVQKLSGMPQESFFKPIYNLEYPLSPHEAAARQGIEIDMKAINLPICDKPIIVEGAGGILVPLNDTHFMIDVMVKFALPIIVVVRSELGTLNHSLLTIQALQARNLFIAGIIMNGKLMPNNVSSLKKFSKIDTIFINEWE